MKCDTILCHAKYLKNNLEEFGFQKGERMEIFIMYIGKNKIERFIDLYSSSGGEGILNLIMMKRGKVILCWRGLINDCI